jgi:hypothetical protein
MSVEMLLAIGIASVGFSGPIQARVKRLDSLNLPPFRRRTSWTSANFSSTKVIRCHRYESQVGNEAEI